MFSRFEQIPPPPLPPVANIIPSIFDVRTSFVIEMRCTVYNQCLQNGPEAAMQKGNWIMDTGAGPKTTTLHQVWKIHSIQIRFVCFERSLFIAQIVFHKQRAHAFHHHLYHIYLLIFLCRRLENSISCCGYGCCSFCTMKVNEAATGTDRMHFDDD